MHGLASIKHLNEQAAHLAASRPAGKATPAPPLKRRVKTIFTGGRERSVPTLAR